MATFYLFAAFVAGLIGLAGVVLGDPALEIPALGIIGLGCLAGIFARFQQAADHHEALDKRLNALFKLLEGR